jgi:DNA (cytosine-5)-methyltransferase 1
MIVDLFAGAGGWAAGMHTLGVDPCDTIAVEWDKHAHATHLSAGFPALGPDSAGDVAALDPHTVAPDGADGLIASPPCQAFSLAGKGAGRDAIGDLLAHVLRCAEGWVEPSGDLCADDTRADLTLQPLRWVDALRPRWVALEQVPTVLPAWHAMAHVLRAWGYSTAVGILSAEEHGVPQTRRRAILVARRDGIPAELPDPTHTKYDHLSVNNGRTPTASLFGPDLLPWVSMAEALDWLAPDEALATMLTAGQTNTAGQRPRAITEPCATITGAGSAAWVFDRPATTVQTGQVVSFPGHHPAHSESPGHQSADAIDARDWPTSQPETADAGDNTAARSVRVSVAQAAALQTFPHDWPWQGPKTARYRQIGNAVPPRLAAAILATLVADLTDPTSTTTQETTMTEPRFMLRFPRLCAAKTCETMLVTGSLVEVVDGAIVCAPCWRK